MDQGAELLGAHRDGRSRRDARRMELRVQAAQPVGDLAEVLVPPSRHGDLVESEHPVREDDRMPQPRGPPRRDAVAQARAPAPRDPDQRQDHEQRGEQEEFPAHAASLDAPGMLSDVGK